MKFKFISFFIIIFSLNSNAKVWQLTKSESLWHLKVTSTGQYIEGNQHRSLFTNKANLSKSWKLLGFISNNTYQYGTVGKKNFVVYNDIRSENLITFLPHIRFSPFVREYVETNKLRQIDFRNELALGGFYKVFVHEQHFISLMASVINQSTICKYSAFNIIDNSSSNKRNVWKWGTGILGVNTIVENQLSTEYQLLYMQNIDLIKDFNYLIDITLNAKIIRGLSFNVNYFQTFENVGMKGISPKEVQLTYGLSYQF